MIRFLIYRPISVLVLYFAALLLAGILIRKMPTSLLPDVSIPNLMIIVEAENYAPWELEYKVLAPMRRYLSAMQGVEEISSTSRWSTGDIRIRFSYGIDMDRAFIETNEMIDLSMNDLPEGIMRPRVVKTRAEDLPVYYLSLSYQPGTKNVDITQLSTFAKEVLRRRLEQLSEVALVDMHGLQGRQLLISPYQEKMSALGIDYQALQKALVNNHMAISSITVKERAYQYLVRIGRPLTDIADLRNVYVEIGSRGFKLSDLASITSQKKLVTGTFLNNGAPALSLAVIKSPQASLDALKSNLEEISQAIQMEHPDILLKISRDQTQLLKATLGNLQTSLVLGCMLAIGIVFFFYGQWRIPAIIGIIIPISLLLSLLQFRIWGLSLNMISLAGLLLGLGLMIDNGIIVLDNISQTWSEGVSRDVACVQGTDEMIRPLLTSMLTTCSVFIPLVFISGISGALFIDQAYAITFGLVTSYVVSITLLPTLYFLLLQKRHFIKVAKPRNASYLVMNIYTGWSGWVFRHKGTTLMASLGFVVAGYYALDKLNVKRLPLLPEKAFEVLINWNAPIQPAVAEERIKSIFDSLPTTYEAYIGVDQFLINALYQGDLSTASVYVRVPPGGNPSLLKNQISEKISANYINTRIHFSHEKNAFEMLFPREDDFIELQCHMPNPSEAERTAIINRLLQRIRKAPFIKEVKTLSPEKSYVIKPNFKNIVAYDINIDHLRAEIEKYLNSYELLELNSFQYSIPVVVSEGSGHLPDIIEKGKILNSENISIPLSLLISHEQQYVQPKVHASSDGRYEPIWVKCSDPIAFQHFTHSLASSFPKIKLEISDSYFAHKHLLKETGLALIVSIILLYFLMTAQFESFIQPAIVLLELPISLAGSVLALWLFGASLNIMSMIGIVITIGIIINDSIIKIDTINRFRRQGSPLKEAIHKGSIKRVNPIVMTTLTTVLAALPFLWGTDLGSMLQRPLAVALLGGLVIGTFVSLYLIPLFYYIAYKTIRA